ncbi:hypothetical protein GCM10025873_19710 [Demequina sediminis]|nr:hypothetical protein GCM10025873_19710 [Demequina sediminis]
MVTKVHNAFMGAPSQGRTDAPVRHAALAGIIVVSVSVALILFSTGVAGRVFGSVEWSDAALPTYPATAWSGEAEPVAEGLTLELVVPQTMCPRARSLDGGHIGVMVASSWTGSWPSVSGFVSGDHYPRLYGGPEGAILEANPEASEVTVEGRMLDLEDPADAVVARSWTDACGEVEAIAIAAPGVSRVERWG